MDPSTMFEASEIKTAIELKKLLLNEKRGEETSKIANDVVSIWDTVIAFSNGEMGYLFKKHIAIPEKGVLIIILKESDDAFITEKLLKIKNFLLDDNRGYIMTELDEKEYRDQNNNYYYYIPPNGITSVYKFAIINDDKEDDLIETNQLKEEALKRIFDSRKKNLNDREEREKSLQAERDRNDEMNEDLKEYFNGITEGIKATLNNLEREANEREEKVKEEKIGSKARMIGFLSYIILMGTAIGLLTGKVIDWNPLATIVSALALSVIFTTLSHKCLSKRGLFDSFEDVTKMDGVRTIIFVTISSVAYVLYKE